MTNVITSFLQKLENALNSGKCERTVMDKDGIHAEYVTGKNYLHMKISSCGDFMETGNEALELYEPNCSEEEAKCIELRGNFHDYVDRLDNHVFREACKTFRKSELKKIDNAIENNDDDPEEMARQIDKFKKACNEVIMNKVLRLKNQMA